jgi:hypothetical protein
MSKVTPEGMPFAEIPNDQVARVEREFRKTVDFLYDHLREVHCVSPLFMMGAFGIEYSLRAWTHDACTTKRRFCTRWAASYYG